jgi:hypothetical protein
MGSPGMDNQNVVASTPNERFALLQNAIFQLQSQIQPAASEGNGMFAASTQQGYNTHNSQQLNNATQNQASSGYDEADMTTQGYEGLLNGGQSSTQAAEPQRYHNPIPAVASANGAQMPVQQEAQNWQQQTPQENAWQQSFQQLSSPNVSQAQAANLLGGNLQGLQSNPFSQVNFGQSLSAGNAASQYQPQEQPQDNGFSAYQQAQGNSYGYASSTHQSTPGYSSGYDAGGLQGFQRHTTQTSQQDQGMHANANLGYQHGQENAQGHGAPASRSTELSQQNQYFQQQQQQQHPEHHPEHHQQF